MVGRPGAVHRSSFFSFPWWLLHPALNAINIPRLIQDRAYFPKRYVPDVLDLVQMVASYEGESLGMVKNFISPEVFYQMIARAGGKLPKQQRQGGQGLLGIFSLGKQLPRPLRAYAMASGNLRKGRPFLSKPVNVVSSIGRIPLGHIGLRIPGNDALIRNS